MVLTKNLHQITEAASVSFCKASASVTCSVTFQALRFSCSMNPKKKPPGTFHRFAKNTADSKKPMSARSGALMPPIHLSQNVDIHPGIRNKGLFKKTKWTVEQYQHLKKNAIFEVHAGIIQQQIVGPRYHTFCFWSWGWKIWDDSNTTQCLSSDTEVLSFTHWILNALEVLTGCHFSI